MTAAVSGDMRQLISDHIAEIERQENARVLFAIESGSRAWGFHSPDSDYDVRFVYVRPVDWHLGLGKKRDVIERPISGALDISGWDLAKALKLMVKSNAVIAEWLQSPIVYQRDEEAMAALSGFAHRALSRRPVTWHYLSVLTSHLERSKTEEQVRIKSFFYALRPALALRWMRLNDQAVPPMDMTSLIEGAALSAEATHKIDALIAAKKQLRERAQVAPPDPSLLHLMKDEADAARLWLAGQEGQSIQPADLMQQAEEMHRHFVKDIS